MKVLEQDILAIEHDVPALQQSYRPDLFTISGFPHYETVLSNWFGFFLEADNKHGLTGLFAEALKDLIQEKNQDSRVDWLNDQVHVVQEQVTKKGNFIDLVVFDEALDNERSFENALIIEHKVHADLNNNLKDYYNSIEVNGAKTGIVLSAKYLKVSNPDYVLITYAELISRLQSNLGRYTINAELNYLGYLRDFINNIDRMSESKNFTEAIEFCFKHGGTIQKINEVKRKAEDDIASNIRDALQNTRFAFQRKYPNSFSIRSKDDNSIVLLLNIAELFSAKKCNLQYWLFRDGAKNWNKVPDNEALKQKFGKRFNIREKKAGKEWVEVLRDEIDFSTYPEMESGFDQALLRYLVEELEPVNLYIEELINQYKDRS